MVILKKLSDMELTNGAKKHLLGSEKVYSDREVRTKHVYNQEVKSEKEFHRKSYATDFSPSKKELHKVRYIRKGNKIVIVHLDRE